jgi:phosphatidylserine decarboxylase
MKFHREGKKIITVTILLFLSLNVLVYWFVPYPGLSFSVVISFICIALVMQFFRVPKRRITQQEGVVVSPCDGKVVVIEETTESEYFNDNRIQISIFMSPLNVHINWYPISGIVKYFKYHPGKYLVAWHPKSSTDNERTTVVVESGSGPSVLFRQIAGAVARRIVCYAKPGEHAEQSKEFGFIKFGSRVDVFLPLGSEIKVNLEETVTGSQTVLAYLPKGSTSAE